MKFTLDKVSAGWLCINAALLTGAFWLAVDRSFDLPSPQSAAVADVRPGSIKPAEQGPVALATFRERPLFASNRRAATAEEIAAAEAAEAALTAPAPPPVLTGYRLTGTLITASKKLAFMQPDGSRDTRSLPVGGDLDGWQLSEISSRQVVFQRDGNQTVFELELKKSHPVAGASSRTDVGAEAAPERQSRNRDRPRKQSKARLYRPPGQ